MCLLRSGAYSNFSNVCAPEPGKSQNRPASRAGKHKNLSNHQFFLDLLGKKLSFTVHLNDNVVFFSWFVVRPSVLSSRQNYRLGACSQWNDTVGKPMCPARGLGNRLRLELGWRSHHRRASRQNIGPRSPWPKATSSDASRPYSEIEILVLRAAAAPGDRDRAAGGTAAGSPSVTVAPEGRGGVPAEPPSQPGRLGA